MAITHKIQSKLGSVKINGCESLIWSNIALRLNSLEKNSSLKLWRRTYIVFPMPLKIWESTYFEQNIFSQFWKLCICTCKYVLLYYKNKKFLLFYTNSSLFYTNSSLFQYGIKCLSNVTCISIFLINYSSHTSQRSFSH